jgi:hypothetical protein
MDPVSEAVASYLDPLLKKHTSGHTLVWEDLEAAYNKSISALRSNDKSSISVSDLIERMNPPTLGLLMSVDMISVRTGTDRGTSQIASQNL